MSSLLKAAVLGIVQGITEFLPVSSNAHLLIGNRLLGFDDPGVVFTTMIHLGSIFAVMWLYRQKIVRVVSTLGSDRDARNFAVAVIVAVIPLLVVGALFSKFVKQVLQGSLTIIAVAFIVGGVVMLVVERLRPDADVLDAERIPIGRAFAVGLGQTLALIPGVSRSGGTIVAAMLLGVDRPAAAEFSFFLAMPTMAAAFAHDLIDARHELGAARVEEIAVGFVMAFVASALVVRPFLEYVRRHGFAPFAWYRIGLGVVMLIAIYAMAAAYLRCRLLRHRAAVRRRRCAHLYLPRRRRRDDAALRPPDRAAHSRPRHAVDGDRDRGGRRGRAQRDRPPCAGARRGVAAEDPGVQDDLLAGEAAARGVRPGQRSELQARGDGRGSAPRLRARISDARVHGRSRQRRSEERRVGKECRTRWLAET